VDEESGSYKNRILCGSKPPFTTELPKKNLFIKPALACEKLGFTANKP
jgi:hypothetical protein